MTNFKRVHEFHTVFGHPAYEKYTTPKYASLMKLRLSLILEEFTELVEAHVKHSPAGEPSPMEHVVAQLKKSLEAIKRAPEQDFAIENPVEVADALADILYVTYGTGVAYGIDLDRAVEIVHESNMSKLDADGKPIYNRETGKIMKGPNYRDPDLSELVK